MKISNAQGLVIELLANGAIRSIERDPIRISIRETTSYSVPASNVFLRWRRGEDIEFHALNGPQSGSRYSATGNQFMARGTWKGIAYLCTLKPLEGKTAWAWEIQLTNTSEDAVLLDLVCVQDVGLKTISDALVNEHYISQYIERSILNDARYGAVLCCRQNMKEASGHPWLMIACSNSAASASTDGMQFYGNAFRETAIPVGLISASLGGEYAGESSVVAIQESPFTLKPGEKHDSAFVALYMADHPAATSPADLGILPGLMSIEHTQIPFNERDAWPELPGNIFHSAALLPAEDLSEDELNQFFGSKRLHAEVADGCLLSFFSEAGHHIVLRSKEVMVDRPHGHILQANAGILPDEGIVSTTAFAYGVFNSHLTQGNTNFNSLFSVCTSPFGHDKESGQRIFIELEGRQYLLGVPSAFEMGLNHCRWIYKYAGNIYQVRTWTSIASPQVHTDFQRIRGKEVGLLISHSFDPLNSWTAEAGELQGEYVLRPRRGSMIFEKFPQAQFRIRIHTMAHSHTAAESQVQNGEENGGPPLFMLSVPHTSRFFMSFAAEVMAPCELINGNDADNQFDNDCADAIAAWQKLSLNLNLLSTDEDALAIREILPWYGTNALIHFLTPYGLEQFSGAAWGTRDVSQGPVELLLSFGRYAEVKQVLRIIFSNQNADGGWPQWWMFDAYTKVRAGDSHGDVYYWCLMALSSYIKASGDLKFLGELLPYYHPDGPEHAERTSLGEHIDRLIDMIIGSFIPGTSLVPFGGGDWNDSLQPVSKELARRLISSWTVEMNYQAFNEIREVYEAVGDTERSNVLKDICLNIKADFNSHLMKDGVVAGYGLVEDDGTIGVLLHPSDETTGIRYSLLPMDRGIISGIFTREQASIHQNLIEKHLKGPDGARLMDRPLKYKGGIQTIFQRAESSTFFGREIGLMYVHEHLRYAESQAVTGRADSFVRALRQANPAAYREIVKQGDLRQSNCYYSSSDVVFSSRYEADERYAEVISGGILLKGGWRVYSSGPAIFISLIMKRLLGLRHEHDRIIIDPVLPYAWDGFKASLSFLGFHTIFSFSVKQDNHSPKAIRVNQTLLDFTYEANEYRQGGAIIPTAQYISLLDKKENTVEILI